MALKSRQVTAAAAAAILATGEPGDAGTPKRVHIKPAADVLIGGVDAQTYPVSTAGILLELVSGDTVYVKRAGGADVVTDVLDVSI